MGDDSSRSIVNALKNEWSLLWHAIQGDDEEAKKSEETFDSETLEALSLQEVKELTRALIEDRKKINQKIESLHKEIDLNSAKLESLRLVGGEEDETIRRIHELNDLGQAMAKTLNKVDGRLREIRDHENKIQEPIAP